MWGYANIIIQYGAGNRQCAQALKYTPKRPQPLDVLYLLWRI